MLQHPDVNLFEYSRKIYIGFFFLLGAGGMQPQPEEQRPMSCSNLVYCWSCAQQRCRYLGSCEDNFPQIWEAYLTIQLTIKINRSAAKWFWSFYIRLVKKGNYLSSYLIYNNFPSGSRWNIVSNNLAWCLENVILLLQKNRAESHWIPSYESPHDSSFNGRRV